MLDNSKNQNLNKCIVKRKKGEAENVWQITLYIHKLGILLHCFIHLSIIN